MASSNNYSDKTVAELTKEFSEKLDNLKENYDTSTSKVQDDLFKFVESNKQNNINSDLYCEKQLNALDLELGTYPQLLSEEIQKITEKHELRVAANNKQIEEFNNDFKQDAKEINIKYDNIVNEENDNLDNKQYLNKKELSDYLLSLDSEEISQKKELENAIVKINFEIESLSNKFNIDKDFLKEEFLTKSAVYNNEIRKVRNDFVLIEKDLRNETKEETISHNKEIEELIKLVAVKNKETNNIFSQGLIELSEEDDKKYETLKDNPELLLQAQTETKIKKGILEINKQYKTLLDKKKIDIQIKNLKINKQDFDNQMTTSTSKENINSLIKIAQFERDIAYEEALKDNKISELSIKGNGKIKLLHESLNDKKAELAFFSERFKALRNFKNEQMQLYSHLFDINTTISLDLNELERKNVLEHQKSLLNNKTEDVIYLNQVSKYEYNNEVIKAESNNKLLNIELERKKVLCKYDNIIFKTRSTFNIEKTRIESILKMFELRYQKEINTFKADIHLINLITYKLKEEITLISNTYIENAKNNKENEKEIIAQFCKMILAEIEYVKEQLEEYFSDLDLRTTSDIDEMINEYVDSTKLKRDNMHSEYEQLIKKNDDLLNEIFELDSDISILETQKRAYLNKLKKEAYYTGKKDIPTTTEFDEQINFKSVELKRLTDKQKVLAKDTNSLELLIQRLDDGTSLFTKKETQKLFGLQFKTFYYDDFDELQEYIQDLFEELVDVTEDCLNKNNVKALYKFSMNFSNKISDFSNNVKLFHSRIIEQYKEQFKRISKMIDISIAKEVHTSDINMANVNRERLQAIEELDNKISLVNRQTRDMENKTNSDIINAKIASEELKKAIEFNLQTYDKNYDLRKNAINSNQNSIKVYYDEKIKMTNKKLDSLLLSLSKERLKAKRAFEVSLERINSDNLINEEKGIQTAKARLVQVEKQYEAKLEELNKQMDILNEMSNKSKKDSDLAILESNQELETIEKDINTKKLAEISKLKKDTYRKLAHSKRKFKH